LNIVLLCTWAYLKFKVLPDLERQRDEKTELLAQKTIEADRVAAKEAQITAFQERRNYIVDLLGRKVYWAQTLDEFASQLTGAAESTPWTVPGFDVRVQSLEISELGGGGRGATAADVRFGFRWRYKIIGNERDRSGDYVRSFFKTMETGRFWTEQNFEGKPEDRYLGDTPRWNEKIAKVMVEGSLDWVRRKPVVEPPKRKPAPAAAPQGN
ncbi:MAG: hypothetical protein H0V25_06595, partial [Solirubrobacterales bacterium]|nr:hypothetical protein [Solirubrobacterales bacterium]